ncbi:Metal-dependent phosphohydrolase, HD subdomain [Salinisphaera sp. T5B8]|uniref:HD-GYP domain-containing protein n=1 Tax=unclassified Salinisphaera TaxID=2649847 RepID=UPI000C419A1E|nr:HD-GYP domain-containing protein [Salinisphaera sp.]MBS61902.1 metal-dependent phosphohydrolase [Salinisphaera sp.]
MLRYAKKIPVTELEPGMYVEALDRPWLETDYPLEGVHIKSRADIERLSRQVEYVYISAPPKPNRIPLPARPEPAGFSRRGLAPAAVYSRSPQSFSAELAQARLIREQARDFVRSIQADARAGHAVDEGDARELVVQMMASVSRNPDALVWFTNLKNRDEYTALHSMNVCMLSVALATTMGEPETEVEEMGVGALLHDIGKMKVPMDILHKPARLSTAEFEVIKQHPQYGVQLLEQGSQLSRDSLRIVLEHHERMNGRGYPGGLKGDEISYYAQIVAIADVYDAMTSDRVYQQSRSPGEVMKLMSRSQGDFNPALLDRFVHTLGAYPVGSLIELNTGEVGFVVPGDPGQKRPLMLVVLDHRKRRYFPQRVRDLNRFPNFRIVRTLANGAYGVDIDDYASAWSG